MDPFAAAHPVHLGPSSLDGESVRLDLGDNRTVTVPRALYTLTLCCPPVERDAWETATPPSFAAPFDPPPGVRYAP